MDFFKYLDHFSIKFNFYTNNQPKHQNAFGGIMTLIYVLICIVIFIIYSYDDLNRLNPITSRSDLSDSKPKIINLSEEKIWIPFRIITKGNKYIDHRGKIYIEPYLVEGKYDENIGLDLKYHLLNYKLCNETSMVYKSENYKINIPLNELFCIDEESILFGGSWDANFINFIEINLYLCEDGIYFNQSDPRCNIIDNFLKSINYSLFFDFYYPVVQFQPTNIRTPMTVIYKKFFSQLTTYNFRLEKLYIKEHILSDDKNYLKKNDKNTSCWGISSIFGDNYYISKEFNHIISNTSHIYKMEIFMDYGLVYYKRTYNKIYLIISNVFPLFKFALYFIKLFSQHVKMSFTKRELIELIFENKKLSKNSLLQFKNLKESFKQSLNKIKEEPKMDDSQNVLLKENKNNNNININNINNNEQIKNVNLNNININKMNITKKIIIINDKEKNSDKDSKNKSILNLNNNNDNEMIDKKKYSFNEPHILVNFLKKKDSFQNSKSIKKYKKNNFLFPYYYYFLDIIFDKLIYPQKFCFLSKTYFTVYNFMCQIYDISTHILLFKQFNLLNNIIKKLYTEKGYCLTQKFKKINISDVKVIEKLNNDLKSKKSILFSKNLF